MEDLGGLIFIIVLALISAAQKWLNKGKEQQEKSDESTLAERKIVVVRTSPKRTVIPIQRVEPQPRKEEESSEPVRRTLSEQTPPEFPQGRTPGGRSARRRAREEEAQAEALSKVDAGIRAELERFSKSSGEVDESVRRHLHVGAQTVSAESQRKIRRKDKHAKLRKNLLKAGGARDGFVLSEVLGPNPHHPTMLSHGRYF